MLAFRLSLEKFPLYTPIRCGIGFFEKGLGRLGRDLVCRQIVEKILLFDTERELLGVLVSQTQLP